MSFVHHHRTIQVAVALYAIVVIPGYGWHLVPGCGHDHCRYAHEPDVVHTHCGHSHHGDHCHHHAANTSAVEGTGQEENGLSSKPSLELGHNACGICQILAKAQVRAVAVEDLTRCQLPDKPPSTCRSLPGAELVAAYSARAPPTSNRA